jgi:hypothetical protein
MRVSEYGPCIQRALKTSVGCETLVTALTKPDTRAGVVELADTPDLGSGAARFGGSSPPSRTQVQGYEYVAEDVRKLRTLLA